MKAVVYDDRIVTKTTKMRILVWVHQSLIHKFYFRKSDQKNGIFHQHFLVDILLVFFGILFHFIFHFFLFLDCNNQIDLKTKLISFHYLFFLHILPFFLLWYFSFNVLFSLFIFSLIFFFFCAPSFIVKSFFHCFNFFSPFEWHKNSNKQTLRKEKTWLA